MVQALNEYQAAVRRDGCVGSRDPFVTAYHLNLVECPYLDYNGVAFGAKAGVEKAGLGHGAEVVVGVDPVEVLDVAHVCGSLVAGVENHHGSASARAGCLGACHHSCHIHEVGVQIGHVLG